MANRRKRLRAFKCRQNAHRWQKWNTATGERDIPTQTIIFRCADCASPLRAWFLMMTTTLAVAG